METHSIVEVSKSSLAETFKWLFEDDIRINGVNPNKISIRKDNFNKNWIKELINYRIKMISWW